MNIDRKKLTLILISLYLIGVVVSAFTLFNLKNRLIYDLHVLDISDAAAADMLFYKAYAIIGLSMIVGLLAIYYSMKSEDVNVIYVEKTKEEEKKEQISENDKAKEENNLQKNDLLKLVNVKNPESEKNLNALLSKICKNLQAGQGAFYFKEVIDARRVIKLKASFAMTIADSEEVIFEFGEGLIGQVAKEQKTMYIDKVPEGIVTILSGLGKSSPSHLLIVPVFTGGRLKGVAEFATFVPVKNKDIRTLEEIFINFGEPISQDEETEKMLAIEEEVAVAANDHEVVKTKKARKK